MDKTFDVLYNEFRSETDGGGHVFVNNRAGYQRWYKDKLFRLCLKYKQAVEADAESRCPECGNTEPVLHCERCGHNWCRTA